MMSETPKINESFISGVSYIAPSEGGAEIPTSALESIPVGIQPTAIGDSIKLFATEEASEVGEAIPDSLPNAQNEAQAKEIQQVASKYVLKNGKGRAFEAAKKAQQVRVSRSIRMAERSRKLPVVCSETGLVSLLEVPNIPGFSLSYTHPLSELANARGIAQRGSSYLWLLDTQVLAGVLIVLANSYSLFRYGAADTGAQKNALLRTVAKSLLVDCIILIEESIHSRNAKFLPGLSLAIDESWDGTDFNLRFRAYITRLSEAIKKPDLEAYDENQKPKKIGRPLYIKDVESKERKVSFLARKEIAEARKILAEDAKAAKILVSNLVSLELARPKMKAFVYQLFGDKGEGLIAAAPELIEMLCSQKLDLIDHDDARKLSAIFKKDRKALKMEVSELEDILDSKVEVEAEPEVKPASIESQEQQESLVAEQAQLEPVAPEGLSTIDRILWKKKWKASQVAFAPKKEVDPSNGIPSVATFSRALDNIEAPPVWKFVGYSADRLYVNFSTGKVAKYFIHDDFGFAVELPMNAEKTGFTMPNCGWRDNSAEIL